VSFALVAEDDLVEESYIDTKLLAARRIVGEGIVRLLFACRIGVGEVDEVRAVG
jgi:hypothetical protein